MADTIREQILVAFQARLATIAGVTVYRRRTKEIGEAKLPALNMLAGLDRVVEEVFGYNKREMVVQVEGFVKATDAAALDTELDQLAGQVSKAVLAGDRRLAGLAVDVTEDEAEQADDEEDGKGAIASFNRNFVVTFFTGAGDPFAAGP